MFIKTGSKYRNLFSGQTLSVLIIRLVFMKQETKGIFFSKEACVNVTVSSYL